MIELWRGLRRPRDRIVDADGLADFLAGRAAFVSQKSTIEYCRARAGICWSQLFLEDEFVRAMEHCRWESYAAVLEDLLEAALVYLRQVGFEGTAQVPALGAVGSAALRRHPPPGHLGSWVEAEAALAARLRRALLAAPRPVHELGRSSAKRVFAALPIHTNLRGHDREVVTNNIRFLLCRAYADLEAQADGQALGRALTAEVGPAASAACP